MGALRHLDWGTYYFFQYHTRDLPEVRSVLAVFAALGSYIVVAVLVALVAWGLLHERKPKTATYFLVCTFLGALLLGLLGLFWEPDRAAEAERLNSGLLQGKALVSCPVFFTMALVAGPALKKSWAQWTFQISCWVLAVAVDLSRLVLGMHFFSEALVALILGFAWAAACRAFQR